MSKHSLQVYGRCLDWRHSHTHSPQVLVYFSLKASGVAHSHRVSLGSIFISHEPVAGETVDITSSFFYIVICLFSFSIGYDFLSDPSWVPEIYLFSSPNHYFTVSRFQVLEKLICCSVPLHHFLGSS